MRILVHRASAVAVVATWVLGVACSSSDEATAKSGLSDGCVINTDCNAPLVCAFSRCHNACNDDRDCPATTRCMASDRPFHVCQLAVEKDCSYNSQCPSGQLCGVDGQCRDECAASRDCVSGQVCAQGTCADPTELVDGGLPPANPQDGGAPPGTPCAYNTECQDPQICRAGTCAVECIGDRDCPDDKSCIASRCRTPMGDGGASDGANDSTTDSTIPDGAPDGFGSACTLPSDCTMPLLCTFGRCAYECNTPFDCAPTQCCSPQHTCLAQSACATDSGADAAAPDASTGAACGDDASCQDNVKCNGFERCVAGHCASALETLCEDNNPCTIDTCTESTGMCAHQATQPVDADHDGHVALACGGTADDCDDTDPTVYPGHGELCDGVDNNCNGFTDEGVWTMSIPVSLSAGGIYPPANGTPAIVRLADGTLDVAVARADGVGRLDGFHLTSQLGILAGPTALAVGGGAPLCGATSASTIERPVAATDGAKLAVGAFKTDAPAASCGCGGGATGDYTETTLGLAVQGDLSAIVPASPSAINRGCTGTPFYRTANPGVAYAPAISQFGFVWSDDHLAPGTGTGNMFIATMTPAGVLSAVRYLMPITADSTTFTGDPLTFGSPQIAIGTSTALVAWRSRFTSYVRYVLMDSALTTVLLGPFDVTPGDTAAASVAFTGTSFALVTATAGATMHIRRIDAASGAELATTTVTETAPVHDTRITAIHGGWALGTARVDRVGFAWAREDLVGGFIAIESGQNGVASGAGIAAIDAKHAAVVWVDGSLRAAIATCGP